jgi:hypothetical protein
MTRRIAGWIAAVSLALLAAAPALAWFGRGRPGIALACVLALAVAAGLAHGSRKARLPVEVQAVLLLPFAAAWGLGEGFGLFARVRGWDALCHFLAGGTLGVVAAGLLADPRRSTGARLLRGLVLAVAIGLVWEAGEWTADRLLGTRTLGTAADTRTDLLCDGLGGLVGAGLAVAGRRYLTVPKWKPWRRAAAAAVSRTRSRRSAGASTSASPARERIRDTR